jgi:hypothetical protein
MLVALAAAASHASYMGSVASRVVRWLRSAATALVKALITGLVAAAAAAGIRRVPPPPPPPPPGYEDLTARLHRLDVEIARLARSDRRTPALYHRLLAVSLAYDAALREACAVVGVSVPGGPPPYDSVARLQAEAGLNAAGLHW